MKKVLKPFGFVAMILLCVVFSESCNGQHRRIAKDGFEIATVKNMVTHIGMDDWERKRTGFDSIQFLVHGGKITTNFCYPNRWFSQRDTVFTADTAYRQYTFGWPVTPNAMILFKNGYISAANYFGDSIIVDDEYLIRISKIDPAKSLGQENEKFQERLKNSFKRDPTRPILYTDDLKYVTMKGETGFDVQVSDTTMLNR